MILESKGPKKIETINILLNIKKINVLIEKIKSVLNKMVLDHRVIKIGEYYKFSSKEKLKIK